MMWICDPTGAWQLHRSGEPQTAAAVAHGLIHDLQIADGLSELIAQSPAPAVFWECAPADSRSATRAPFACRVLPAPSLAEVRADPRPFGATLADSSEVVTFDNLRGDACLVAPTLALDLDLGAHLARFVRRAPRAVQRQLWGAVGDALRFWWRDRPQQPVWLSTSGLGVSWLHVRLDCRPKYITHAPYRSWPQPETS